MKNITFKWKILSIVFISIIFSVTIVSIESIISIKDLSEENIRLFNDVKNLELEEQIISMKEKVDEKIESTIIKMSLISAFFISLAFFIISLFSSKYIVKPFERFECNLISFFKYLNKEIEYIKPLEIDSSDEIGFMSRVVNENIINTQEMLESERVDELTNLPNMKAFFEDTQNSSMKNIVLFNIDGFRKLTSVYGYGFVDKILTSLAKKIKEEVLNTNDFKLYRYHGDWFIILQDEKSNSDIVDIYKKLLDQFSKKPLEVEEKQLSLSFTAGIAKSNEPIKHAELAFQKAKEQKSSYAIYDKDQGLIEEYKQYVQMLKIIRNAIEKDLVYPYFQLIRDNENPNNKKYESLMRIKTPFGESYSPFIFLETAKKAKLYGSLSRIMMKKTIQRFEKEDASFSINLEVEDILDESTMKFLYDLIIEYKVENKIILEITESEYVEDCKKIVEVFKSFKNLGVKIAIDDFGTGYSNFSYLAEFDFDFIKIDGSLIKNIHKDKNSFIIVELIVGFAKKLNKKVIAEFIENEEIQKVIEDLKIDYSQGYLFSKPSDKLI